MANSDKVATQQRCNVQLRIKGRLFGVCCYIMPLPEHIGIILGQDWHMQRKVVTNWATMTCEVFHRNNQHVFTQEGFTPVTDGQPSMHHVRWPYLHYLQKIDKDDDPGESDPQDWDKIPTEYRSLVEEYRDMSLKTYQQVCHLSGHMWIT